MVGTTSEQPEGSQGLLRAARGGNLSKVIEHIEAKVDINTSNSNGLTALHLAAKEGHQEVVRELLRRGIQVDAPTKKGNTALHIACLAGQLDVVKLLVHGGANVNFQSQVGFTPLYMASQENNVEVVSYLLSAGSNQTLATQDGFTPLAVALQQGHDRVVTLLLENDTRSKVRLPALHIAAKKDDVGAVALLLNSETNIDHQSSSGFTPLHIASHYGNENTGKLLIERGANVNFQAKNNITPLHVAAKWGRTGMIRLLAQSGAMVDCRTRDGLTPLHCAARSGYNQVVEVLMDSGANISAKTRNGLSPLHMAAQGDHDETARMIIYKGGNMDETTVDYLTPLHVAAHCGNVRVAKLILEMGCEVNARALNGFTPLHIACKKMKIKVVELLLQYQALMEATTETGLTPLHVASFVGSKEIVVLLLQRGANVDQATMRFETALHLATRNTQIDVVKILLKHGATVDAKARENQTPLHVAVRTGNVELVGLLLSAGANPNLATKDNYTALHISAKEGRADVASLLLDNGAEIEMTTKKGFTPLHVASKYGQVSVARLLLESRAKPNSAGKNGLTPLHVATHYNHLKVAQLLLDNGASPLTTARNGYTPLHIAAKKNHGDIAQLLLISDSDANAESRNGFAPLHLASQEGNTDIVTLLLKHRSKVNQQAKNGLTAMHLAAQEDRVPVAEILVKGGAHIKPTTIAGYTPLHTACHFGQLNMIRFLLTHGAQVNAQTALGFTPLHLAAQQGHLQAVYILLESGADPNIKNQQGWTPAHIARRQHYLNIFEVLRKVTTVVVSWEEEVTEEIIELERPEHMGEHAVSDSDDEGGAATLEKREKPGRKKKKKKPGHLEDDSVFTDSSLERSKRGTISMFGTMDSVILSPTGESNDDIWRQMEYMQRNIGEDSSLQESGIQEKNEFGSYGKNATLSEEDTIDATRIQGQFAATNGTEWEFEADNVPIVRKPIASGFLVSFLVDARGGILQARRHPDMRILIPSNAASQPTRVTCRLMRSERLPKPPQFNDGDGLACKILEMGPGNARFNAPILLEIPHYASLRGREREVIVLRSENGETWKEHPLDATEQAVKDSIGTHFNDTLATNDELRLRRVVRILTTDFPLYFALITRVRQEVALIGSEGGVLSSSVVPQVQAAFPETALQKKIKVGLQALPVPNELVTKLLGNRVAVSPIVTVEPRRRKFHKPITLTIPLPRATSAGMINPESTTLRLMCSITGGSAPATWEDITGSSPLTRTKDCVSFTTTVSARMWLIDCQNIAEVSEMAGRLYREAMAVPYIASFVVYARRHEAEEAQLRCICVTDDNAEKTLELQEHFDIVATGPPVEVLNDREHWLETAGNLVPVTKTGEQLALHVNAFHENRLPFTVRVKDAHQPAVGKLAFMTIPRGGVLGSPGSGPGSTSGQPQKPITTLEVTLPDDIYVPGQKHRTRKVKSMTKNWVQTTSETKTIARSELDLAEVANCVNGDWRALAEALGLRPNEIDRIGQEYETDEERAFAVLTTWTRDAGHRATGNELARALRDIGREDVVFACMSNVAYVTSPEEQEAAEDRLRARQPTDDGSSEGDARRSVDESMIAEWGDDGSQQVVDLEDEDDAFEDKITMENRTRPQMQVDLLAIPKDAPKKVPRKVIDEVSHMETVTTVEASPHREDFATYSAVPTTMKLEEDEDEFALKANKVVTDVIDAARRDPNARRKDASKMPELKHDISHGTAPTEADRDLPHDHDDDKMFEETFMGDIATPETAHHHHHGLKQTQELIEGKPEEKTEVKEYEEVLPDGTVVQKRVQKTEISQVITEKSSREFCEDAHSDHDHQEIPGEHEIIHEEPVEHTEVQEVEETLPDGSVVKRIITTRRVTQKVTEKTLTDDVHEDEHSSCHSSASSSCSGGENVSEMVKEVTETLPDGSKVTKKVIVKRVRHDDDEFCDDDENVAKS